MSFFNRIALRFYDDNRKPIPEQTILAIQRALPNCAIVGSFVYNHVVLKNPHTNDIDLVTNDDPIEVARELQSAMTCHKRANTPYENAWSGRCYTPTCKVDIDILHVDDYRQLIRENGVTMANSLYLDPVGNICDIDGNKKRRDFTIMSLLQHEYCPTNNMRDKDKVYFRTFRRIDPVTCAKNGYQYYQ